MEMYILKGKTPVKESDPIKWSEWLSTANRKVQKDIADITYKGIHVGRVEVSTVFLGLDHSFEELIPMLFETLVFGGPNDGCMTRCSTWAQAEQMHEDMLNEIKFQLEQQGKEYEHVTDY